MCINGDCTCPQCNLPNAKASCINQQCIIDSCNPGWGNCDNSVPNGCELALGADPKNCGACGNACAQGLVCTNGGCTCPQCNFPNASSQCINNMCVFDKCNAGFGNCDNNVQNGCEANFQTDNANCGACGKACAMSKIAKCSPGRSWLTTVRPASNANSTVPSREPPSMTMMSSTNDRSSRGSVALRPALLRS